MENRHDQFEQINAQIYEGDNFCRMPEVYSWINGEVHRLAAHRRPTVLDIGCGDGSLMQRIKGHCLSIAGCDIVEGHLRTARKGGLNVVQCNIDTQRLPFRSSEFDIVISSEVIEHVMVPDRLLDEARRVLAPTGKLILTTPNLASFGKRLLLLSGRNPFIEISPLEPRAVGHVRYFIYSTLEILLSRCGFRIERFSSDVVNFCGSGRVSSEALAKMFPTFGRSLMVVAAPNPS